MDLFNSIGIDLQSEILKYNPSYFQVKKNLDKNLFYNRYCNQPISIHEFLSYIQAERPPEFIIYTGTDTTFTSYIFKGSFTIKEMYIFEEDINEFSIDMTYKPSRLSPKALLNTIKYEQIYFDLRTTFNILSRRSCEQISPGYNTRMTLFIFNQHTSTFKHLDLYSYFDLCKTLIYDANNYDLLSNQTLRMALHRSGISKLTFNSVGDLIEGTGIEKMIIEYDFKDEIVDMILQL